MTATPLRIAAGDAPVDDLGACADLAGEIRGVAATLPGGEGAA